MSAEQDETDPLARLEAQLDRAAHAAEGLLAEAASRAAGTTRRPPAAGWQAPDPEEPRRDIEVIASMVDAVREFIPPELQRRLAEALRELLMAVRALIDWCLERAAERRATPSEVEEIPIE